MTTLEQLQLLLAKKFSVPPEKVQLDARLDTLGLDSLDLIEVLFEVEEEFKIRVPQDGGAALLTATVGDIVDSIERAQAAEPAAPSVPPSAPPPVQ
jgi:acyl carrier protein